MMHKCKMFQAWQIVHISCGTAAQCNSFHPMHVQPHKQQAPELVDMERERRCRERTLTRLRTKPRLKKAMTSTDMATPVVRTIWAVAT